MSESKGSRNLPWHVKCIRCEKVKLKKLKRIEATKRFIYLDEEGHKWVNDFCGPCYSAIKSKKVNSRVRKIKRLCRTCNKPLPTGRWMWHVDCSNHLQDQENDVDQFYACGTGVGMGYPDL